MLFERVLKTTALRETNLLLSSSYVRRFDLLIHITKQVEPLVSLPGETWPSFISHSLRRWDWFSPLPSVDNNE